MAHASEGELLSLEEAIKLETEERTAATSFGGSLSKRSILHARRPFLTQAKELFALAEEINVWSTTANLVENYAVFCHEGGCRSTSGSS